MNNIVAVQDRVSSYVQEETPLINQEQLQHPNPGATCPPILLCCQSTPGWYVGTGIGGLSYPASRQRTGLSEESLEDVYNITAISMDSITMKIQQNVYNLPGKPSNQNKPAAPAKHAEYTNCLEASFV